MLRFDCDECGDEITDTLYFVRATLITRVIAEVHRDCFTKHVADNMDLWFNQHGLVEFGYQLLSAGDASVRPTHRNGIK